MRRFMLIAAALATVVALSAGPAGARPRPHATMAQVQIPAFQLQYRKHHDVAYPALDKVLAEGGVEPIHRAQADAILLNQDFVKRKSGLYAPFPDKKGNICSEHKKVCRAVIACVAAGAAAYVKARHDHYSKIDSAVLAASACALAALGAASFR
jgi:hypothetical protein